MRWQSSTIVIKHCQDAIASRYDVLRYLRQITDKKFARVHHCTILFRHVKTLRVEVPALSAKSRFDQPVGSHDADSRCPLWTWLFTRSLTSEFSWVEISNMAAAIVAYYGIQNEKGPAFK